MNKRNGIWKILASCLLLPVAWAQATDHQVMREDKGHVTTWNTFTDDVYALHLENIEGRKLRIEVEPGGYSGRPAFYRQETYVDEATGLTLGVIQWERENPDTIHSITVYRYDDQGRVLRDYSSTYLPDYRNAPTQTLVFLHRYPPGMHAMRSFDASDDLLYERCEGLFNGEPAFISLDIDEIEEAMGERYQYNRGIMTEPVYQHCFDSMPDSARHALPPN
jgi:hypothetical protein